MGSRALDSKNKNFTSNFKNRLFLNSEKNNSKIKTKNANLIERYFYNRTLVWYLLFVII